MAREQRILDALFQGRDRPPDDDGALLAPPSSGHLVLTTDALEEGVHFRAGWLSLEDLAWKALAVNLSDLAAMGAEPVGYLLSLAWPESLGADEATAFGRALAEREAAWGCPLLGGDTDVRDAALRIEVTMIGRTDRPILRATARAGDSLFVSGPLGGAAAVVEKRLAGEAVDDSSDAWRDALRRFARPQPRLDVARQLAGRATALIDLSDGLRHDASRLALASGLSARLDLARIPSHPAVPADSLERLALDGGEEYELLAAGPADLEGLAGLIRVGQLEAGPAGIVHAG